MTLQRNRLLVGSGGKSGAGRSAQEDPDSLRSKSLAQIVDLLSEGEIEGLVNESGQLLVDAQIASQPVVTSGRLTTPPVVVPGSSGYPSVVSCVIKDERGVNGQIYAYATNGEITHLEIANAGSGYLSPVVTIPPATGQAIYLDDVPLQNSSDLSYNFQDVSIVGTNGTPFQDPLPGFERTQRIIVSKNDDILEATPHVVEITDSTVTSLIIGIYVPALYQQSRTTGDVTGYSVTYSVYIQYRPNASSSFSAEQFMYRDVIEGKASRGYLRTREVDVSFLRQAGTDDHQWRLVIKRESPDIVSDSAKNNRTQLSFVTGVTNTPLAYPYSAVQGIQVNAQTFSRIPVRSFLVKLLRIQVPSNYFPETRKYNRNPETGAAEPVEQYWDGTFYTAWSNNPAWCFYDICTDKRYGMGSVFGEGRIDKWALYKIARYCDELVDDGFGGKEPRFTCNLYLQTRQEAYKVMQDMASIFRALLYWGNDTVVPVQDAPTEPFRSFTNANVKDGTFNYSGTSRKVRHTVAYVRWNDPNDRYRSKPEYVEDIEGILRWGIRPLDLTAMGCTSRGQAHRFGLWALYSERLETDSVNFSTGMEGITLRPGMVISVFDNSRSGVNYAGRIKHISNDRTKVTTDRKQKITEANNTLILVNPRPIGPVAPITSSAQLDELFQSQLIRVQVSSVSQDPTGNLVLNLSAPIPEGVDLGSVWGLQNSSIRPQYFRLMAVEESAKHEFEVTGIAHSPTKFDEVEKGLRFEDAPISTLATDYLSPRAPQNLQASVEVITTAQGKVYNVSLAWDAPAGSYVQEYEVQMRKGLGNFHYKTTVASTQADVEVTVPDTYSFRVVSIGVKGARSNFSEVSALVRENVNAPDEQVAGIDEITGLELLNQGNDSEFIGRDFTVDWRVNSKMNSFELGSEPSGASSGGNSTEFLHYIVRFYSVATDALLYQTQTNLSSYTLRFDDNAALTDGPHRSLVVEVLSKNTRNEYSEPVQLRVDNPHPPFPIGVTVSLTADNRLSFLFAASTQRDFAGRRVWVKLGSAPTITDAPTYEGTANPVLIPVSLGATYHFRFAEYDSFSKAGEYATMDVDTLADVVSADDTFDT